MHVTNVVSQVSKLKNDRRLQNMFSVIKEKETNQGYIPETIYMHWKEWDFSQKRKVSECLNLSQYKQTKKISANELKRSNILIKVMIEIFTLAVEKE